MTSAARAHLDKQAQPSPQRQPPAATPTRTAPPTRTPRPPAPAPGTDAWRERALQLAELRHLTGTVAFLGCNATERYESYEVPTSRRDGHYRVVYDRVAGRFDATHCLAAAHDRPCAHVGAVLASAAFRFFRGELVLTDPDWQAKVWRSEKAVDEMEQGWQMAGEEVGRTRQPHNGG